MNARFFLDTNIFVYSFDREAGGKQRRAAQLIQQAISTRKGVVSTQVAQEFFNVALRKFAQPLTPSEAEQYLAIVFRPMLAVHSSPALMGEGLRLVSRYKLHWYDALIVAAAQEAQCDVLYSEDLQHGQRIEKLRIANPFL
jgi:predicted nucleic acid-binding protein